MAGYDNQDASGVPGLSMGKFGAAAQKAIDLNALREKLRPHQALALWPQIAGDKLAGVCTAESVRGNVLFVRVKSSAWANEMSFYKADLLGKLNGRLGSKLIEDIHFATARPATRGASAQTIKPPAPEPELRDLSRIAPPTPPAAAVDMQARMDHLVERTRSVLAWKKANGWVPCARCEALFEPAPETSNVAVSTRARKRRLAPPQSGAAKICPVCIALTHR